MSLLNLFNGDCACEEWKKTGLNGDTLVWRENYLNGILPSPETPLEEFERIRAAELHRFVPDIAEERILKSLRNMDAKLLSLTENDRLLLWFDACMFDQTLLSRVLFLLNSMRNKPETRLICRDLVWDVNAFLKHRNDAVHLSNADLAAGADAWRAFSSGKEAVRAMLQHEFPAFPFLHFALERFFQEMPDENGMTRSQRQILKILQGKNGLSPFELFRALDDYEDYPFMGDSSLWQILDELAGQKILRFQGTEKPLCSLSAEELKQVQIISVADIPEGRF